MSYQECPEPECHEFAPAPAVDTVIVPRARDIGGFEVRRALPNVKKRMVGPFIFFDQMGPNEFLLGKGLDVRPHPHIGLSTLTYLLDGEIIHKDSLGTDLPIRPGEVNWMTAGSGIAHSERTSAAARQTVSRLYGLQAWIALPARDEETAPGFFHYDKPELPTHAAEGKQVRLIAGSMYGMTSPVKTSSAMMYADVHLEAGARLPIETEHEERALYPLDGEIDVNGDVFGPHQLLVLHPGDPITVTARRAARLMVLGGAPMEGPRYIWWNFVSSSQDRIEQAKADWQAGKFAPVPNDPEFTPLPAS